MKHTLYKNCKAFLKQTAERMSRDDKPKYNMILNDTLDYLIKGDLTQALLKEEISSGQFNLYSYWLDNYCTKLHRT